MSGIFPRMVDGGLPPNPDDRSNPAMAFPPTRPPAGTEALYYGNGCDVRLRPEVVNALISEIVSTVDAGEVSYDPGRLTNLLLGTNYLVQRGMMSGLELQNGPQFYTGLMTPPATRYNNFMTIRVVPLVTNNGAMQLNLNGLGYVPVLRNDGAQLQALDFPGGIPEILIYYNGIFYVPYLVRSQSPPIYKGSVNYWVRTDGSDSSGNGSANTPAAAFRTIQFAWMTALSRYVANPELTVNIRLGIAGAYEYAQFSRFPGNVGLYGDENNFANYKISCSPTNYVAIEVDQTSALIAGVTLMMDKVNPNGGGTLGLMSWRNARAIMRNCGVEQTVQTAGIGAFVEAASSGTINCSETITMDGHGNTIGSVVAAIGAGNIALSGYYPTERQLNITFKNMVIRDGGYLADVVSSIGVTNNLYQGTPMVVITTTNTTGPQWLASANSVIRAGGKAIPGSVAGSVADYGVFNP